MPLSNSLLVILAIALTGFFVARHRAFAIATRQGGASQLHSLPLYYGYLASIWAIVPAVLLLALWGATENTLIDRSVLSLAPAGVVEQGEDQLALMLNQVKNISAGAVDADPNNALQAAMVERMQSLQGISLTAKSALAILLAAVGAFWAFRQVKPGYRARVKVEGFVRITMMICASVAILTTVGIVLSVLFESVRFFGKVPVSEFMLGTHWSPQTSIRADQVASEGSFGAIPLFVGTLLISAIALIVAVPIGLMSAIYLTEYAKPKVRSFAKPAMEILAGIPTVVYGFFAALTVAPALRGWGESMGLSVSSESALAAGLVMGVMIIPFVSSLSDDVLNAVPQSMRDGSLGLGATKSETIRQVIIPAALPGIVGGVLLAASRAIGETMIVVMAAGLAANMTVNPLEAVTTVTVQIVTLLTGDQEFDSAKTLAAFALGLMLFATTLILNVIALHVVRKYREQYE
ncbi:MAG: phosphate ABC transporter permease subunit PstC [Granulosicoccaceae bacterium]